MKPIKQLSFLLFILLSNILVAQPVANFTANRTSGCSPLNVQFTNQATGSPTTFFWTFGNGNNSSLPNPSATYIVPGVYSVSLEVSNSAGNNTLTRTAYITVFTSPVANFSASSTNGCFPLNTSFTDQTTSGSAGIRNWLWDFGDGNLSNLSNPTHVYQTAGVRTVSLTVTDSNGCTNTTQKNNFITITPGITADFNLTNPLVCLPPSSHTITPVVSPANPLYQYQWNTTTGQQSNSTVANFNFNSTTNVGITLRVFLVGGCTTIVNKPMAVRVLNNKANFIVPSPLCASRPLVFTNTSTPDSTAVTYRWQVNNGTVNTNKNLSTSLPAGNHTVRLITSLGVCRDTLLQTITVNNNPSSAFTPSQSGFCKVPANINFIANSNASGLIYNWNFDNGQTSVASSFNATFTQEKAYRVSLKVSDANGCFDSTVQVINFQKFAPVMVLDSGKKGCAPFANRLRLGSYSGVRSVTWRVNGNVISNDSVVNHIFPSNGNYIVTATVTNTDSCIANLVDTVNVGTKLTFDFTADKRLSCYSTINPVRLTALENSGIPNLKYNWSWKNGGASEKITNAELLDTGSYDITLTIDNNGCLSKLTKEDYIIVRPARAIANKPDISCATDSVFFQATQSRGKNKYLWIFGDGDSSTKISTYHQFENSGIYDVMLIALDTVYNCADTTVVRVQVPERPTLDFVVRDSVGCSPLRVTMENKTQVGANGFNIVFTQWRFSSNQVASGNTASSILTGSGWRSLTMTVTDSRNCTYTLKRDSVARPISGIARMNLVRDSLCAPARVTFTENSTTDLPVVQRKWIWTPTDSVTFDTARSASFIYNQPANPQSAGYNVRLIVRDSIGCIFATNSTVRPSKPLPVIQVSRNFSCGAQAITFTGSNAPAHVLSPGTYRWNIGNEPTFTGRTVTRNYSVLDTVINIRLTVTDSNNCTQSRDTNIVIRNRKPSIGFYANPQNLLCYLPIVPIRLFDTTVIGAAPVAEWRWRIGNNTSQLRNPEVTFVRPGKYSVSLFIRDSAGCVDSVTMPEYLVLGGPLGSYSFTPNTGCRPLKINFTVNSPNAKYYIWDFGDGLVDTVPPGTNEYTYTDADTYYPRLTLVDSSGTCLYGYDAIDSIVVYPLPRPNFTADKEVICYNNQVTFFNTSLNKPSIKDWKWRIQNDSFMFHGPVERLFPDSGKFAITLIATDTNNCIDSMVKPQFITVIKDTIPPKVPESFRATVLNNSQTHFEFSKAQESDFNAYRVFYNFNGNTPLNFTDLNVAEDTIYLHDNLITLLNTYSYSVNAKDVCNNQSDTSIMHTTVELQTNSIANGIAGRWTPYVGFDSIKRYEVWRNNPDSGNNFVHVFSTTPDNRTFLDTFVTCFKTYFYRIKTISAADTTRYSWSDTSGSTPTFESTVPGTNNIRTTVVNDQFVLLQWQRRSHKINFSYVVYKKRDDESEPILYKTLTDTFLVDNDVEVDKHSYTYITYLKDECGGLSMESNMAKTILLKVDLQENDLLKYDPIINFTPYQQWSAGVSKYQADFYYDSASAFTTITDLAPSDTLFFHKYVDLKQIDYCYKVTAYSNESEKIFSESNIACIETKPRLYAPNVFTLNGDQLNDVFKVGGVFVESFILKIFDRWGNKVFETTNMEEGWDGTINGKPGAPDVYVYIAEGRGRMNQIKVIEGNVTLLR